MIEKIKRNLLQTGLVVDNEYLDKYCLLVVNNLQTQYNSLKTQQHHIIPRLYFKNNNLPLDNSKANIINLLYKDHMLAHFYLMKCAKEEVFKYKMAYAVQFVTTAKNITERELLLKLDFYQECYEIMQEGKKHYKHSEQIKQKLSNNRKNRVCIYKNNINKCCLKEQLELYLAQGWQLGRCIQSNPNNKGKICINYDGHNKYINQDELDYYISLGAKLGGIKQTIINKGNRGKKSLELRKKLSQLRTGQIAIHHKISGKTKYINKEDLNKYLDEYEVGGGTHAPTVLNKIWVHNTEKEILINKSELDKYKSLGYKLGRRKAGG